MYNGELHCRTVFSLLFVELLVIILFAEFLISSIGEFIVRCSYFHLVFLQAAAKSSSVYFLCPGMRMDSFVETPNNIMEDTMP